MTQVTERKDDEIQQYHLKKLFELSLKTIGEIPQLEDPTFEQSQWVKRKMRGSARSWEINHV